eukprot:8984943-Prorocentrum_lima.AAC.1
MTSSLVGSEMCIRDRVSDRKALIPRLGDSSQHRQRRETKASWLLDSAPVSYTHLTLPTICSV